MTDTTQPAEPSEEGLNRWTTERQPGDDAECERLGCEDRTHPVHHRVSDDETLVKNLGAYGEVWE